MDLIQKAWYEACHLVHLKILRPDRMVSRFLQMKLRRTLEGQYIRNTLLEVKRWQSSRHLKELVDLVASRFSLELWICLLMRELPSSYSRSLFLKRNLCSSVKWHLARESGLMEMNKTRLKQSTVQKNTYVRLIGIILTRFTISFSNLTSIAHQSWNWVLSVSRFCLELLLGVLQSQNSVTTTDGNRSIC